VIAIDTIKIARMIEGIFDKDSRKDNKIKETKLICIPGIKPVKVPARIPTARAIMKYKNI